MNIINKLLTPNKFSRPQKPLTKVKGIVIHWVANKNSTAMSNRNYFEDRKNGKNDYGSSHCVVDLNGDIVICIPENEVAYHCGSKTYTQDCLNRLGNSPNNCTYGIECTHIDDNGIMTKETNDSLLQLCVNLCKKWKLNPINDLWLHFDVVGWKDCHRWFVNNPIAWTNFKQKVADKLNPPIPQILQIQQWQIDSMNWLKQQKIITIDHSPNEIITFKIIAYLLNNITLKQTNINALTWLMSNGYIKNLHQENETITLSTFGYMMSNKLKEALICSPLEYLLNKGFINQARNNPNEGLTFALFGAMMKNAYNKGIRL